MKRGGMNSTCESPQSLNGQAHADNGGGLGMVSTAQKGRTVLRGTDVPQDVGGRSIRSEFARIARRWPRKLVARKAKRVEKAVEHWRNERSMADAESLFDLAQPGDEIGEATWAWIKARCGRGDEDFYEAHAQAERNYRASQIRGKE